MAPPYPFLGVQRRHRTPCGAILGRRGCGFWDGVGADRGGGEARAAARPTLGSAMRTGLAYTTARILILVVSLVVLYFCGARGFLLLGLAFVISAIASYILLFKQRELMAGALNRRIDKATAKATGKAAEFRERLEEGAAAEDDAPADTDATAAAATAPADLTAPADVTAADATAGQQDAR
jgi:hypothetical protein